LRAAGAEKSSGDTGQRTPLSKQGNKQQQCTLIEATKMAPRYKPDLAMPYDREKQKGNANRATPAVARKLVAYLMAVDRWQRNFQVVEASKLHRCVECGGGHGRISSARRLPGLAANATGRRSASSGCSR
jgi:hypothetical protein